MSKPTAAVKRALADIDECARPDGWAIMWRTPPRTLARCVAEGLLESGTVGYCGAYRLTPAGQAVRAADRKKGA